MVAAAKAEVARGRDDEAALGDGAGGGDEGLPVLLRERVGHQSFLDRATIRTIAKETGWSSGVLAHCFVDKDDILVSAPRLAHERIEARWEEKLAGRTGMAALRELVMDNLPLDDERQRETRFLMNYWSRSMRGTGIDARDGDETWRRGPRLVDRLAGLATDAQRAGELDPEADPEDVAERLLALIDGLSLHALLDPQRVATLADAATGGGQVAADCQGTPVRGGSLVYQRQSETQSLNPITLRNGNGDIFATELIYNGLVRSAPTGKTDDLVGGVAAKWEKSADGKTYTFHVRPGDQVLQRRPGHRRRREADLVRRTSVDGAAWRNATHLGAVAAG